MGRKNLGVNILNVVTFHFKRHEWWKSDGCKTKPSSKPSSKTDTKIMSCQGNQNLHPDSSRSSVSPGPDCDIMTNTHTHTLAHKVKTLPATNHSVFGKKAAQD